MSHDLGVLCCDTPLIRVEKSFQARLVVKNVAGSAHLSFGGRVGVAAEDVVYEVMEDAGAFLSVTSGMLNPTATRARWLRDLGGAAGASRRQIPESD